MKRNEHVTLLNWISNVTDDKIIIVKTRGFFLNLLINKCLTSFGIILILLEEKLLMYIYSSNMEIS